MKTIGLIGGMSWESTAVYYRRINEAVKARLGGLHSAKLLMYSVDFHEIEECQAQGDWAKSADLLSDAAVRLERAGADLIVICTNTMHKVAPQIAAGLKIPLLHIADATAQALLRKDIRRAALLGTKYTMCQDFYKERLLSAGIDVLIPDDTDIEMTNRVIYNELCLGIVSESSKREYLRIISGLAVRGAEGVILGCTEIGLLIDREDTDLPVFDTTEIHAMAAVDAALCDA